MFLRRCVRRKSGKRHTYWALVESYRTGRGSRQRVVAYLGELKRSEQSGWAQLGRKLSGKQRPQRSLFDPPHYEEPAADDEPVLVRLKGVALERLRDFGDVWLALGLWRLLELHIEDTWYRQTALEDLLSVAVEKVHTDRLYTGLDVLLPCKEALEKHLRQRLGDLFDLEYDLLLYDVTSTYFEGACAANPLAKRGYSRDGRPQCLQVCIGLVVTPEGIPLGYEVFPGNRNDAKTVEEIVLAMEKKYGRARRVWVMDRGMVSEDNLEFLRSREGQYIVGTPKAMLRRFAQHLLEKGWQEVQEGVEVKLVPGPDGTETFVLARSADRRKKEEAMHHRFVERFEAALRRMQAQAESGRLKDPAVANRRLGRLAQQYWRAAGAFDVTIQRRRGRGKGRLKVSWKRDTRWSDWAALSEGCYLLRTNLTETDPATLWKQYIQLTEAEWAFRISKDELEIRPIWHHTEQRVLAHILVCFLAYVLWKTLAGWMQRAGLGDAPRTLLEELAKIKSGDVILPTVNKNGEPKKTIRLRCVTEPDPGQKVLLHRLGIQLPRRLRRFDELVQM
jgi:transposase